MTEQRRQDSLYAFLLLTFAVTWLSWAAWALSRSASTSNPLASLGGAVLFYLGVFAPSLVAMWLTRRKEGEKGLSELLRRVLRFDVGLRWYLFALTYFLAIKLVAVLVYRLIIGDWPQLSEEPWYLMAGGVLISTPAQFGEEAGWRGYALPRLAARLGYGPACVAVGVIWAAWHLPLFYISATEMTGQAFIPYALGVTALSVAIGWLYLHTGGSLFLAMLMHSAINNTNIAPFRDPNATNPLSLGLALLPWLTIGLLWIGAAYFLMRMRRAQESQ